MQILSNSSSFLHRFGTVPLLAVGTALLASVQWSPAARAQTPAVSTERAIYHVGEPIAVSFQDGPGNRKDWIGIYPDGSVPGDVLSTLWNYVDGTQTGSLGVSEGRIVFPGGLNSEGAWVAYLLENDSYEILAETRFDVADPTVPLARADKRVYAPGEAISVTFTNGPANPKDWIGIYRKDQAPGTVDSTLWSYVDGTQTGTVGADNGAVAFPGGLTEVGEWMVYFLMDDGYDILASEAISVEAPASSPPRVIAIDPVNNSTNAPPKPIFSATILQGTTRVNTNSVQLKFNGIALTPQIEDLTDRIRVRGSIDNIMRPSTEHTFTLVFADTVGALYTNEVAFKVAPYQYLTLPAPIILETFDTTPEGELPAGWTEKSYTVVENPEKDLNDLNSASYATWTVVDMDRFKGSFITYSNPDAPQSEKDDYKRVLTPGPPAVVNGKLITEPASGRMLFGNSGYRNGGSQVLYVYTPDFDLTGRSNVHLSFYSLWEQNQDSIGAVEYSIDQGESWRPIVYYLEANDIVKDESGEVDAVATFTAEQFDVASYTDEDGNFVGGSYGAFIAAPVSEALAPFIRSSRDDDTSNGKRVELFRLVDADNQGAVRFRFAHAGTDSWYFGVDNFGLYSINEAEPAPTLSISLAGNQATITWQPNAAGFFLESSDGVAGSVWTPVPTIMGNSVTVTVTETNRYYRLRK